MPNNDDPFELIFQSFDQRNIKTPLSDKEVRVPQVFHSVWQRLSLLPDPQKIILVTGSKGKGTVARQIARNLQTKGDKVGIVLSPEERTHLDRIRIDFTPIPFDVFQTHLMQILPMLQDQMALELPQKYLSPTGIFLSIALAWFATQSLDWIVIEGGRGVEYDEIGCLNARLGVVTSVFPEHVTALGGSYERVLLDKLSLVRRVDRCLLSHQVIQAVELHPSAMSEFRAHANRFALQPFKSDPPTLQRRHAEGYPRWYDNLVQLSFNALDLLGSHQSPWTAYPTPSFAHAATPAGQLWVEPVIHHLSLDPSFIKTHIPCTATIALGLTPDKDRQGIEALFRELGFTKFYFFSIQWVDSKEPMAINVIQPDLAQLHGMLTQLMLEHGAVYALGVQTFIRSIRLAFHL